jgi:hypothetical protein
VRLEHLIARDGPVCVWCGRQLWRCDLTAEHLLPRSQRGRGQPENLAVACRACNRQRRTTGVAAFARAASAAGRQPRIDLLRGALVRLAASPLPSHARYAERQLELLARLEAR